MAHFILQDREEGNVFIHFNGTYHSNNFEGIGYYLKEQAPDLVIKTIASVEQGQMDSLAEENNGLADFIIVIDEDMTKTYK